MMWRVLPAVGAVAAVMLFVGTVYQMGVTAERGRWQAKTAEASRDALESAWDDFTEALAAREALLVARAEIDRQAAQIAAMGPVVAPKPEIVYVETDTPHFDCGWLRDAAARTDRALAELAGGAGVSASTEPGATDAPPDAGATGVTCTITELMNWAAFMETTYRREMTRFVRLQREVSYED